MEENYILLMIQNFNGSLNENIKLKYCKTKRKYLRPRGRMAMQ